MAARKEAIELLRYEILDHLTEASEDQLLDLYYLIKRGSQPPPPMTGNADTYRTLLKSDRPGSTLEVVAAAMAKLGEPTNMARIQRAVHVDHPEISDAAIRGAVQRLIKAGRVARLPGSGEYRLDLPAKV